MQMAPDEWCLVRIGNGTGRCEKVQKRRRSLSSCSLSIYRMARPHWPLRHWANSGTGLSGFPEVDVMAGARCQAVGGVWWPKS